MGVAMLGNYRFRLNPDSVFWDFTIKARDIKTVGGKVVQVYGTQLGDMVVTGSFGRGREHEQGRMLEAMNKVGQAMMDQSRTKASVQPIRFIYPPRKWDFRVYLKEFSNPDAGEQAVNHRQENVNLRWQLRLFVVEDNGNVKKVAQDAYIARLAAGLGWKLTTYNGPNPAETASLITEAGGIEAFLLDKMLPGVGP